MWSYLNGSSVLVFTDDNTPSDKGTKAAPSEAAAAAGTSPTKRLDNLFFIEEPKSVSVAESE